MIFITEAKFSQVLEMWLLSRSAPGITVFAENIKLNLSKNSEAPKDGNPGFLALHTYKRNKSPKHVSLFTFLTVATLESILQLKVTGMNPWSFLSVPYFIQCYLYILLADWCNLISRYDYSFLTYLLYWWFINSIKVQDLVSHVHWLEVVRLSFTYTSANLVQK